MLIRCTEVAEFTGDHGEHRYRKNARYHLHVRIREDAGISHVNPIGDNKQAIDKR